MKERSKKKVGEMEVRKEEDKGVKKVYTRNWSFKIICVSWIVDVLVWFPRHLNVTVFESSSNKASLKAIQFLTEILVRSSCWVLYSLFFHSVHPVTNMTSDIPSSVYIPYITEKHSYTIYITKGTCSTFTSTVERSNI